MEAWLGRQHFLCPQSSPQGSSLLEPALCLETLDRAQGLEGSVLGEPGVAACTDAGPPGAHHCPHYRAEVNVHLFVTHSWKEPFCWGSFLIALGKRQIDSLDMVLPGGAHRPEAALETQGRNLGEIREDFLEEVTDEQTLEV